jgi:hypothetical protein
MTFFFFLVAERLNTRPKIDVDPWRMCTSRLDLFDGLSSTPNRYRMQKLCPREVDVSTNHIGAHKPFGVSSYGVMVLDVWGFLIDALC